MKKESYAYCIVHFNAGERISGQKSEFIYAVVKCSNISSALMILLDEVNIDVFPGIWCISSIQMQSESTFRRCNVSSVVELIKKTEKDVTYIDIWAL